MNRNNAFNVSVNFTSILTETSATGKWYLGLPCANLCLCINRRLPKNVRHSKNISRHNRGISFSKLSGKHLAGQC